MPVAKFRGEVVPMVFDLICPIYVYMREIYWCGSEAAVWEILWRNIYWRWYWFSVFLTRVITFQLHSLTYSLLFVYCLKEPWRSYHQHTAERTHCFVILHALCVLYIYIYIYIYIYTHIKHTYICACALECVCVYIYTHTHTYTHKTYIHTYVRVRLSVCVCMCWITWDVTGYPGDPLPISVNYCVESII